MPAKITGYGSQQTFYSQINSLNVIPKYRQEINLPVNLFIMTPLDNIRHFNFTINDLHVKPLDIEKWAQVGENMPSYTDFLNQELIRLNKTSNIEGGYVIHQEEIINNEIHVKDQIFKAGKQVNEFLDKMTHAAIFVFTAGREVTDRAHQLNEEGHLVEAYLLDVLGNILVEKGMDKMQAALQEALKQEGLRSTNRYSPGYCDWNINEQKSLFSFFPEGFCNVTLNQSCLMNPLKTVSGIIGIGKNVKYHKNVCNYCNNLNCLYQNAREVHGLN